MARNYRWCLSFSCFMVLLRHVFSIVHSIRYCHQHCQETLIAIDSVVYKPYKGNDTNNNDNNNDNDNDNDNDISIEHNNDGKTYRKLNNNINIHGYIVILYRKRKLHVRLTTTQNKATF